MSGAFMVKPIRMGANKNTNAPTTMASFLCRWVGVGSLARSESSNRMAIATA